MSVESQSPIRIEWTPIWPPSDWQSQVTWHNHTSWFLTICWMNSNVILHLLVAIACDSIYYRVHYQSSPRFRKCNQTKVYPRSLVVVYSLFCFPVHSLQRKSRGNANEEVIVSKCVTFEIRETAVPAFAISQCAMCGRPLCELTRLDCRYDIIWCNKSTEEVIVWSSTLL